jgi:GT2 family glycosyltransferase
MVRKHFPWVKVVENKKNLGFAAGNNRARPFCRGEFVLFLNSDTTVEKGTVKETIEYIKYNKKVGALTCKIELPSGNLDKDAIRSFPTPWIALTHFSKLDRLFNKSKLFSKYWYDYKSENVIQEVDVIQGAYFLTRKSLLDDVDWFDEDYFLDGEDIDLCWKIKRRGWKVIYYPKVKIIHHKGATKGKNKKAEKKVHLKKRIKFVMAGVDSMEIFYRKRLWNRYPLIVNYLVIFAIKTVKLTRLMKLFLFK